MTPALTILDTVQIASPCSADWQKMSGNDRFRFCESCEKHVYNIVAMTADDALALIREQEGNLCLRLYRRADGTVLTADCPVGVRAVWRRTRQLVAASSVAAMLGLGALLLPNLVQARTSSGSNPSSSATLHKASALWDELLVWTGIRQRYVIVGDMQATVTCPSNPSDQ